MLPLRNTLRPEFGIFIFLSVFSAKLRLGRISAVVTGGGIRKIFFFFSFGNSFNETTSILEGRIVKVSHSTRTANLQLVDPACAAAQEHVETRIWNFHFLSVFFSQIAARAYFGSCNRWRN